MRLNEDIWYTVITFLYNENCYNTLKTCLDISLTCKDLRREIKKTIKMNKTDRTYMDSFLLHIPPSMEFRIKIKYELRRLSLITSDPYNETQRTTSKKCLCILKNGRQCSRNPTNGNKYCWQHIHK